MQTSRSWFLGAFLFFGASVSMLVGGLADWWTAVSVVVTISASIAMAVRGSRAIAAQTAPSPES